MIMRLLAALIGLRVMSRAWGLLASLWPLLACWVVWHWVSAWAGHEAALARLAHDQAAIDIWETRQPWLRAASPALVLLLCMLGVRAFGKWSIVVSAVGCLISAILAGWAE